MGTTYFPILKAKDAEFKALKMSHNDVVSSICPLFDIPRFNPELKASMGNPLAKACYLDDISRKIALVCKGKEVFIDSYVWKNPGELVETGEHHLSYLYNQLNSMGVIARPVIGYDRIGDEEYRQALKSISQKHVAGFGLRLEHFAFGDCNDPIHFHEQLSEIIEYLGIEPSSCHVFLDMQDLSDLSLERSISMFETLFNEISIYGFGAFSIAGCSLPPSIDKAVKTKDSSGSVLRKEMLIWKHVRQNYPNQKVFFGDYAVRGPRTTEKGFGNTNAKIRYTVDNNYFVVRGHVIRKPIGGFQHCNLAETLIQTGPYLGEGFSWGDARIMECSKGKFGGGSTTWIEIDSNHHFKHVVLEVSEFERVLNSQYLKSN